MDPDLATLNELFTTTYRSVLKVEEVMLRHLSNGSLTLSEMHMLECIGKRKGDAAITDIAQELDITPPSVTMAVKRLEKKGFITEGPLQGGWPPRARAPHRGRPPRRDRPPLLSPPDAARRVARSGTGPARGPALRPCEHQRIYAPEGRRIRRREEGTRMRILGTGSALPAHTLTNDDLSKFLDTSDEWIRTHTGIRSRQGHHRRDALAARRPRRQRRAGKTPALPLRTSTISLHPASCRTPSPPPSAAFCRRRSARTARRWT